MQINELIVNEWYWIWPKTIWDNGNRAEPYASKVVHDQFNGRLFINGTTIDDSFFERADLIGPIPKPKEI